MTHYVYLMKLEEDNNSKRKIGMSGDPEERLSVLTQGTHRTLAIDAKYEFDSEDEASDFEDELQNKYKEYEINPEVQKGEWFDLTGCLDEVKEFCEERSN